MPSCKFIQGLVCSEEFLRLRCVIGIGESRAESISSDSTESLRNLFRSLSPRLLWSSFVSKRNLECKRPLFLFKDFSFFFLVLLFFNVFELNSIFEKKSQHSTENTLLEYKIYNKTFSVRLFFFVVVFIIFVLMYIFLLINSPENLLCFCEKLIKNVNRVC